VVPADQLAFVQEFLRVDCGGADWAEMSMAAARSFNLPK
jgi:hypothetical protein